MRHLLVIDNSTLFHAVFRDMFNALLPGAIVHTALGIDQAEADYIELQFDLVIADLEQGGDAPLNTLQRLNALYEGTRLVLMTMHKPSADLAQILQAEDHLLIEKMSTYQDVAGALVKFLSLKRHPTPASGNIFSSTVQVTGHKALTLKQVQIMDLVSAGLTVKETARELGLSPETVKAHLAEIYRRLGVVNRSSAVDMYLSAKKYSEKLED